MPKMWSSETNDAPNEWWFMFFSTFFFFSFNKFLQANCFEPRSIGSDYKRTFRWRNFCVSMCHSFMSGSFGLYLVMKNPVIIKDYDSMVHAYSRESILLENFMIGYFVYDTIDILINSQMWSQDAINQFVFHHIAIFSCLLPSVYMKKYVSWSAVGSVVELGNVFLHCRQLMLLANVDRQSEKFKLVASLTSFSMLVTRSFSGFLMTYCLLRDPFTLFQQNPIYYPFLLFGTLSLDLYSGYLFLRLVKSDFGVQNNPENRKKSLKSSEDHD